MKCSICSTTSRRVEGAAGRLGGWGGGGGWPAGVQPACVRQAAQSEGRAMNVEQHGAVPVCSRVVVHSSGPVSLTRTGSTISMTKGDTTAII
jgi:hypothetical protein